MAVRVQCPFCARNLKMRQAPAPGKLLPCPNCGHSFAAPADLAAEATAALTPAPAASAPAPDWALSAVQPAAPQSAAPTPLPSSVLKPIAPPPLPAAALTPLPPLPLPVRPLPAEEPAAPSKRRALLIGAIAGGLLLLVGSTVLAVALAARADRRSKTEPVAREDQGSSEPEKPALLTQLSSHDAEGDRGRDVDRSTSHYQLNDDSAPAPRRAKEDPPPDDSRKATTRAPAHEARSTLPRELQAEVNKAVEKGVAYLKKAQMPSGSWDVSHPVGMAALPGLTLLECGVKPDDPAVQKAAKYVRANVMKPNFTATYECSLSLLFLDRLGDPQDRRLIRDLALRLVAGQLPGGGWSYSLPDLSDKESRELVQFLERTRPERNVDFVVREKDRGKDQGEITKDRGKGQPEITSKDKKGLDAYYEALESAKGDKKKEGVGDSGMSDRERKKEKQLTQQEAKKAFDKLPAKVRSAPAVSDPVNKKAEKGKPVFGAGDNSNTQFAMLALWAARRHGLPLERSLAAVGKRFRDSQSPQGTWGYTAGQNVGASPAMTGAGLLGLAVGHGSATDPDRKFKVKDPQIDKGLKALGQHVGKPLGGKYTRKNAKGKVVVQRHQAVNLYLLWTVERVGVLYDVHELDGKDWYLWGVEILLPAQADEGSWSLGGYHGATRNIDTSFALLFLKRANLASDLTRRLEFVVEGKPTRR